MHDIHLYLLLPEQARWADKQGFDAKCLVTMKNNEFIFNREPVSNYMLRQLNIKKTITVPTFDQFFDWCEEKWGIRMLLDYSTHHGQYYFVIKRTPFNYYERISVEYHTDKRSARIACVNEIIKYIDNLKK